MAMIASSPFLEWEELARLGLACTEADGVAQGLGRGEGSVEGGLEHGPPSGDDGIAMRCGPDFRGQATRGGAQSLALLVGTVDELLELRRLRVVEADKTNGHRDASVSYTVAYGSSVGSFMRWRILE
ncbi:hypothetical protein [Streptomyces sp. NPDC017260]|uniref:hypothetical protein n=1 Tax=unclassified Streptomyces TaxID=2593676 RepID=UPI0037A58E7E